MHVVAQGPLEDKSRRLQVAELEQDKTENAASHPLFGRAPFGFPKEGLGCFTRLAILAAHEACQRLRVVGDEARIGAVRRSREFAGGRQSGQLNSSSSRPPVCPPCAPPRRCAEV